MWDPGQYERFRGERSRPFFDLLARIPDRSYKAIVDLGCGTGDLTAALADHWPEARVVGQDQSAEMLAPAKSAEVAGRLEFAQGDMAVWRPSGAVDLVVSNAAIHWVPDQSALLRHIVSYMAPRGVLAIQLPNNNRSPSHALLGEVEESGPWRDKLQGRRRSDMVLPASRYVDMLWAAGLTADAWETEYLHVLAGEDAVLEWMKGTTLRPILARLDESERKDFLSVYSAKLREAYPPTPKGTLFPFRRLFFNGVRP